MDRETELKRLAQFDNAAKYGIYVAPLSNREEAIRDMKTFIAKQKKKQHSK